ncbi:MAG: hypothetical protein COZ18_15855 [Flexibacter sp. CG_4_10_14_3_um_filter_32_15]|nr:MAG: hypothetical protein COZ18_15855 [Flexibacter sp. CG_4_10_14_3_um_filter_32_15]
MKHSLLTFLLLFYSTFAFGQLVEYDFTGQGGNTDTNPTSIATNTNASTITRGSGLSLPGSPCSNCINAIGWNSASYDANDYFEFTLTPTTSFALNLATAAISFNQLRSSTGATNYEIRTSLDGYATSIGSGTTSSSASNRSATFPNTALYSSITSAVTIRIYGYGASGAGGTWRLQNTLTVTGTVTSTAPAEINLTFDDNGNLNLAQGSNTNVIFRTQAQVTSASAILNQVVLRTNGTYTNTDIAANGFKLWYSADNIFDVSDTQLSAVGSVTGNGETITFPTLSQSIAINTTGYFFVTADISTTATLNNTIGIANTTTADFTFASPSDKTGTDAAGNLHTIIGLNTGTVTTSLCVTPTQGESINIPFTYSPTGLYTGTFTAQLSDASGSFAVPTSIGSVASNNIGNQTISATIPANTPQGSNYRIRVVSSVPNIQGADNGSDITIDLLTVSIAPTAIQNISQFQNGTTLTVTESSAITSRRWKYRTSPSVSYTTFLGNSTTETPYFETAGTYFMVVETVFACGKTVISNEVQINVATFVGTRLFPGDMAIVGWDATIGTARDGYAITNLVPLKQGTKFLVANATYENGAAANTRTNVWQNGREYIEFTYNRATDLPAGSIISFEFTNLIGDDAKNIRINGVAAGANITSTVGFSNAKPNISTTKPDQIFIMQGKFNTAGTNFDGYVLFGMTNDAAWVNLTSSVSTARTSRLHPHILCINTSHPTGVAGSYFNISNAAFRNADQRTILGHITNMSNWTTSASLPAAVHTTTFNVTSQTLKSEWIGNKNTNWFDCQNWSSLYVPDRYTDVAFTTSAIGNSRIDETAAFSNEYLDIAETKNIVLGNRTLQIYESRNARLDVYENLTIQNTGVLDMDNDAGLTNDGTINLQGNWINNVGTAAFEEGESIIIFKGGNAQSITTAAGNESFYDVTLNCGQDLTINNETIIKREFLFQSGNVFAATSNPLTFDITAFHTGATVNKHIRGASRKISNSVENFVFPIGKSGIYRPLTLHTQSGGTSTQFFAEYFYAPYTNIQPVLTPLDHVSQIEHWILNRESGAANARLTLSWGIESVVGNLASLVVAHWTSTNQWESKGNSLTTGNTTAGTVKSADIITQFSPFTLGTIDDTNLLPVTWLSFDAKYNQEQENILLEWTTATEYQNQSFIVERSENGIDFKEIGIKKGNSNSRSIKKYQFWDLEILNRKTYYRIKQVDLNGDFSYSTVKMIETKGTKKLGITHYHNKTILYSNLNESTKAKVMIYDMNGNTVGIFEAFLRKGQNELLLPFYTTSKAVYIYKIEVENQSDFVSGKFLVK